MKDLILEHVDALVSNFLYYDRKEDEDLPVGAIEGAILLEKISVEEVVEKFKSSLVHSIS